MLGSKKCRGPVVTHSPLRRGRASAPIGIGVLPPWGLGRKTSVAKKWPPGRCADRRAARTVFSIRVQVLLSPLQPGPRARHSTHGPGLLAIPLRAPSTPPRCSFGRGSWGCFVFAIYPHPTLPFSLHENWGVCNTLGRVSSSHLPNAAACCGFELPRMQIRRSSSYRLSANFDHMKFSEVRLLEYGYSRLYDP